MAVAQGPRHCGGHPACAPTTLPGCPGHSYIASGPSTHGQGLARGARGAGCSHQSRVLILSTLNSASVGKGVWIVMREGTRPKRCPGALAAPHQALGRAAPHRRAPCEAIFMPPCQLPSCSWRGDKQQVPCTPCPYTSRCSAE